MITSITIPRRKPEADLEQRRAERDLFNRMETLIRAYEQVVTRESLDFLAAKYKAGEFPYIPLNYQQFNTALSHVAKKLGIRTWPSTGEDRKKFIDVGCGIGSKVFWAASMGFDAYGIEISRKYVQAARNLCKSPSMYRSVTQKATIICGNALKASYEKYDVIYFYCPLSNSRLEYQLEERIILTAKPGAHILAFRCGGDLGSPFEKHKKLLKPVLPDFNGGIFQKLG